MNLTLLSILAVLAIMAAVLATLNALTIVTISAKSDEAIRDSVAILIPMRNEEKHVGTVIQAALASESLASFQIIALDDSSTDGTLARLTEQATHSSQLTILNGLPLPAGWMGKPFACQQLAEAAIAAGAEYLVFLDADTHISPRAVAASIGAMRLRKWDFISPHPREIAGSPLARLIQPLMQWSWFASVPVRLGITLKIPSMAIANGQCVIVKSSAYSKIGGHAAVRDQVLEDLEIARTLVRNDYKGGVAVAAGLIECQMYDSDSELRSGYSKSLWRAFGSGIGATLAITLLLGSQTLPFLIALTGSLMAWKIYAINAFTHLLVATKTRSNPINAFAHPLAIAILAAMIVESFVKRARGDLHWKDRTIV